MCDEPAFDAMLAAQRPSNGFTRRDFGAWSLGAGVASLLPLSAAAAVSGTDVDIRTADGTADGYFVHPARGTHPGVLMWPDIFGLRPAFRQMADRLASAGYAVLVVNPFYRVQRAPTAPEHADLQDPATRERLMGLMSAVTPEMVVRDGGAYLDYLQAQPATARHRPLATTGYCMSGPYTLRLAAAYPDRIAAGASFHGAALATDKPDSPHLLVPRIRAHFLIAIAQSDDQREPQAKTLLRTAFDAAHLTANIEVYAGAQHGWCPPDSRVYNHELAEKAWAQLLALLHTSLEHRLS